MSHDALIERFDQHMVRIDEELRLSREANERHAEMFTDTREFIREMTLRMHHDGNAMVAALDANTAALQTELADGRAQLRASTAAVLKMLDRLDGK